MDSTRRPAWLITLPTENQAVWEKFATFVFRATNGHPVTDADSSRSSLTIESPKMRGDTIVLGFASGGSWRCPDGWPGSGSWYELRLVPNRWDRNHRQPLPVVVVSHWDSIPGCGRR